MSEEQELQKILYTNTDRQELVPVTANCLARLMSKASINTYVYRSRYGGDPVVILAHNLDEAKKLAWEELRSKGMGFDGIVIELNPNTQAMIL